MAVPHKPSPRVALARWLAQIHYNAVRRIEQTFETIKLDRHDLRGFLIAEDLVLTRKRVFCKIVGKQAVPQSIEEVAANYNLERLQEKYREAQEAWKNEQRNRKRRNAS